MGTAEYGALQEHAPLVTSHVAVASPPLRQSLLLRQLALVASCMRERTPYHRHPVPLHAPDLLAQAAKRVVENGGVAVAVPVLSVQHTERPHMHDRERTALGATPGRKGRLTARQYAPGNAQNEQATASANARCEN